MAKSDKLYKDSPKIEKDGDGKPGIKKPSKADGENMGIEGNPQPGAGDGMPVPVDEKMEEMHGRHTREMKDMHKRHEDEHKDMNKRHMKEAGKLSGTPGEDIKEDKKEGK